VLQSVALRLFGHSSSRRNASVYKVSASVSIVR
jgi:hypothetical protein